MLVVGPSLICFGVLGLLLNRPITAAMHVLLGEELARLGGYARNPRTGRATSVTLVASLVLLVGLGMTIAGLVTT